MSPAAFAARFYAARIPSQANPTRIGVSWIEEKLYELTQKFALDLCAYAVMSNHYHVVLYVDTAQAEAWSREEVIHRWHQLFNGTLLSQRYGRGAT